MSLLRQYCHRALTEAQLPPALLSLAQTGYAGARVSIYCSSARLPTQCQPILRVELAGGIHRTVMSELRDDFDEKHSQGVEPGKLAQYMWFVVLFVHLVDLRHCFDPLGLEMSRGIPLAIMRSFRLDCRDRGWVIHSKLFRLSSNQRKARLQRG